MTQLVQRPTANFNLILIIVTSYHNVVFVVNENLFRLSYRYEKRSKEFRPKIQKVSSIIF